MLLGSLFTTWNYGEVCTIGWLSLGLSKVDYVILGVGVMIVWAVSLCKARGITMKTVCAFPGTCDGSCDYGVSIWNVWTWL